MGSETVNLPYNFISKKVHVSTHKVGGMCNFMRISCCMCCNMERLLPVIGSRGLLLALIADSEL